MRYHSTAMAILCISVTGFPAATFAQSDQLVFGGDGGIPWLEVAQSTEGIDATASPGVLQQTLLRPGENIVTRLDWGSSASVSVPTLAGGLDDAVYFAVDGDPASSTEGLFDEFGTSPLGQIIELDLGASLPIDRVVFYPRQEGSDSEGAYRERFLRSFEVLTNDGSEATSIDGRPFFELVHRESENTETIVTIALPAQPLRFLRIRILTVLPFEIAEIELYGTGFTPGASLETQVIPLVGFPEGARASFATSTLEFGNGELFEVPENEAETAVSVRLKTGRDDTPLAYFEIDFFSGDTFEVSEDEYFRLNPNDRAIGEDARNWSSWSLPLIQGDHGPDPNDWDFFMLEVNLHSDNTLQTARLDSLLFSPLIEPPTTDGECSARKGDLTIKNDADIGSIRDLGACITLDGNLSIELDTDIFDSLPIAEITGDLLVTGTRLVGLDGLADLTAVGGNLEIFSNEVLTDMRGLSGLRTVGGTVWVIGNPMLPDLGGLGSLTSVGLGLSIFNNPGLSRIGDLSSLTSIRGNLSIEMNTALADVDGLANLEAIDGDLSIVGNAALVNLDGLGTVTVIGGNITIKENDVLNDLSGLSGIGAVPGFFTIDRNPDLIDLTGLHSVEHIGRHSQSPAGFRSPGLTIMSNNGLESLNGLGSLSTVEGSIDISFNRKLADLDGLTNLANLGGGLTITSNTVLSDISGLRSLRAVGGDYGTDVRIVANDQLHDLSGLSNLTSIQGGLTIGSTAMVDLDALSKGLRRNNWRKY